MSSFDKVVKLACKPKAAAPKAKYLDPIVAATWSDEGAIHDVCKALSPRFREPNAVVVFKALIVLHTMIRNGATDNVLGHLSNSDTLRLRNVSASSWEGYTAPENLQHYAGYLDARIRAYTDLKHDAIRVQSETNRDMRNSVSVVEGDNRSRQQKVAASQALGPSRSKTISGRKLRSMTVEKGLLRETKAVHKQIDALVECRFYLDDLEDELTITALRMCVKDLLILFQAGNEGVINLLEQYFEMSHIDAEEALGIYKRFCKQTEKVMEYLGVARKLQNLLNVPIPTLKHAPVSLASSLQEYLDDPQFEQNRVEYKTAKQSVDRNNRSGNITLKSKGDKKASDKPAGMPSEAATSKPVASISAPTKKQDSVDLFDSIDEPTSQPQPQVQMQIPGNPFNPTMTGQPFLQAQATGFYQTQSPTNNPFGLQIPQVTGIPVSTFVPNQSVGMFSAQQPNFAQSQPIGVNPFRMSVLVPQTTGMAMFNVNGGASTVPLSMNTFSTGSPGPFANPFLVNSTDFLQQQPQQQQPPFAPVPSFGASLFNSTPGGGNSKTGAPARPGSAPLTTIGPSATSMSPPTPQPVKTHQTGSRNPFGRVATPPPPVPRTPTIMELTMKQFGQNQSASNFNPSMVGTNGDQNRSQPAGAGGFLSNSQFGLSSGALSVGATDMSGVASTFSFNPTSKQNPSPSSPSIASGPGLNGLGGAVSVMNPQNTVAGSTFSGSLWPSSLPSQQTGATPASIAPSITFSGPGFGSSALTSNPTGAGGLQSQATGFGGLKPFKPSSSFGAALLDSLPPVPSSPLSNGPSSASPGTNLNSTPTSIGDISGFGSNSGSSLTPSANAISYSPFGTGIQQQTPQPIANGAPKTMLGVGLRPQMTGGTVNPFRASMVLNGAGGTNIGNPGGGSIPPLPTMNFQPQHPQQGGPGGAFPGNTFNANGGNGASMFNGNFGGQPQQQSQSLI